MSTAPSRERLPNRRQSASFSFACGGLRYAATYSNFEGGRVAELFLSNTKPASQSDINARDAAVAASLALQYGCPLEVLRRALLREPSGRASSPLGVALDLIAEAKP